MLFTNDIFKESDINQEVSILKNMMESDKQNQEYYQKISDPKLFTN
jgi:hypothetical protein